MVLAVWGIEVYGTPDSYGLVNKFWEEQQLCMRSSHLSFII